MAILNSLDLLAQKTIVQVNEINTKIVAPNSSGSTVKIDASDHREVETAILDLVGDLIDSSYNKLDGLLLSDIITGNDGDMLQWEDSSTSWITVPIPDTSAAGNIYEIQYNDNGSFGSSSNFIYDFDLNDFKVLNSTNTFQLEAAGTKNFVVTKDTLSINNLLQIDSTSDVITIGAINSLVKLQRGSSALDESLTLTTDLLSIQNTNLIVKTVSTTTGNGFELRDSSDNLSFRVGNNKDFEIYTNNIRIPSGSLNLSIGGTATDSSGAMALGSGSIASNTGMAWGRSAVATGSRSLAIGAFVSATIGSTAVFGAPQDGACARITDVYFGSGYEMLNNAVGASSTTPVRYRGTDAAPLTNNLGGNVSLLSGRGQGTGLSGSVSIGYKQQNAIDRSIFTIQEKIAGSVTGIAKVTCLLETYADNAAALVGGLTINDLYKTATGEIRIVV